MQDFRTHEEELEDWKDRAEAAIKEAEDQLRNN